MAEEEAEREFEVRSLTGESTIVSISVNKTVEDLKELLKHTFKPAAEHPNFHLFFKVTSFRICSSFRVSKEVLYFIFV